MRGFLACLLCTLPATLAGADLVLSDCDSDTGWQGATGIETGDVKQGRGAIRWNWEQSKSVTLSGFPEDWSGGNALSFWVHTDTPHVYSPSLQINGRAAADQPARAATAPLRMRLAGWMPFIIPFEEFYGKSLPDWTQIVSLTISIGAEQWPGIKPVPGTELLLDDVRVINLVTPPVGQGPRMTDDEFFQALDLGRPEMAEVKAALGRDDRAAAKHAFGEYIRTRKTPVWFDHWNTRQGSVWNDATRQRVEATLRGEYRMGKEVYKPEGRVDWSYNPECYRSGPLETGEYNAVLNRFIYFADLYAGYVSTRDERYAQKMVADMVAWAQDCPRLMLRDGNSPYHYAWETLNVAARLLQFWAHPIAVTQASPAWTDDAVVTVWKSLHEQAEHLVRNPSIVVGNNWVISEMTGVLYTALMNPQFQRSPFWRDVAAQRLTDELHRQVYPDGVQWELAAGYMIGVTESFVAALQLATLNGQQGLFPNDYLATVERMVNYLCYNSMPNRVLVGPNDSGNHPLPVGLLKDAVKLFPERKDFLWFATAGAEGQTPPPDSVAFPYAGQYMMRTGWDPANSLYLMLDAGTWGASHQHEDKLAFTLYGYGKELIREAGSHMYDTSPERKYVLSTRAHNTIRVDGQDQRRAFVPTTWTLPKPYQPLGNLWLTTPQFDLVEGSYEDGYGDRKTNIAVKHTRRVFFVKPQYWIVTDILQPADNAAHSYESLFHLNAADAAADGLLVSTREPTANIQLLAAPFDGLAVQIVKGQTDPELQGWVDRNFTTLKPCPTAVYRWQGTGPQRLTLVLYPLRPGETCPVTAVRSLPVTDSQGQPVAASACEIVFADGARHLYCSRDASAGEVHFADFATDAQAAVLMLDRDGKVEKACVADGKALYCRGQKVPRDEGVP